MSVAHEKLSGVTWAAVWRVEGLVKYERERVTRGHASLEKKIEN